MSKDKSFQKGDRVYDNIHGTAGTVEALVPKPQDEHHEAFYVVKLDDGRTVHLTDAELSAE